MSISMAGVRPEQGPPLGVPLTFFATGPLALLAAGIFLAFRGDDGMSSMWETSALAAVHLGAVGLLLFVMTGALYQLLPTVAGAVMPMVRLGHVVHALLLGGSALLLVAQAGGPPAAFAWAAALLLAALALFLAQAGFALARSRATGPTVWGLRVALVALAAVAFAGLTLASARSGAGIAPIVGASWLTLRFAHAHLGFLAWIGGLVTAVSWQVLPMFYLAKAPPRAVTSLTLGGILASLVLLVAALFIDVPPSAVAWLALPGALAVWALHPAWALVALRRRTRRRKDATLWFWWLAMGVAPLCLAAGVASLWSASPKLPLAYGLLVLFGWAGTLVHGMLTRIVPFLVWLHWCAPHVGKRPTPSARELLPHRHVALAFATHAATLAAGLVAVAVGSSTAWRIFGVGLLATGVMLAFEIATVLRRGRASGAAPTPTGA